MSRLSSSATYVIVAAAVVVAVAWSGVVAGIAFLLVREAFRWLT